MKTSSLQKIILAASLLGVTACATSPASSPAVESKFYHRFYQGYRLDVVTVPKFEAIMNQEFLPLFPPANPLGLHAYRPALPVSPAGCELPAEIALLTFESETVYAKYRETELGKKIRDAHTKVFHAEKSKSLVPEPYRNKVETGHAYNLREEFNDYQPAESMLIVHCNPRSDKDLLSAVNQTYVSGSVATNILFALSPKHVAEYVFAGPSSNLEQIVAERTQRFSKIFKQTVVIRLEKQKIGSAPVKIGQGVDAQW